MTKKEAAIIMAFTGYDTLVGDDIEKYFLPYARKVLGIFLKSYESMNENDKKKLQQGAMNDFVKICTRAVDVDNI